MIEPTEENHNTIHWLQEIQSGRVKWANTFGCHLEYSEDRKKLVAKCPIGIFVISHRPKLWWEFLNPNEYVVNFEYTDTEDDSFFEQVSEFVKENAININSCKFTTILEAQITILFFMGTVCDHISKQNARKRLGTYAADMAKLEKLQKLLNKTP